ncbi:lipopolysaccharide assembly protein b [Anaeramoeba flamelloides]|uniref:Lipopolysaccharide assembly protein b n=1 Tax=Anaeramoeba flamelloides TaxID=1746091 RepID=A0ABQ8XPP9_9EUKA|nr:lipopolysaccharide assembly protein b [Anaeramoeba flamelloides]
MLFSNKSSKSDPELDHEQITNSRKEKVKENKNHKQLHPDNPTPAFRHELIEDLKMNDLVATKSRSFNKRSKKLTCLQPLLITKTKTNKQQKFVTQNSVSDSLLKKKYCLTSFKYHFPFNNEIIYVKNQESNCNLPPISGKAIQHKITTNYKKEIMGIYEYYTNDQVNNKILFTLDRTQIQFFEHRSKGWGAFVMQNGNSPKTFSNKIKGLLNITQKNSESHYAELHKNIKENLTIIIRPHGLKGGEYWEKIIKLFETLIKQLRNNETSLKNIHNILIEILTSLEDDEIIIQKGPNIKNNIKNNLKLLDEWIEDEAPKKKKQMINPLMLEIKNKLNLEFEQLITTSTTSTCSSLSNENNGIEVCEKEKHTKENNLKHTLEKEQSKSKENTVEKKKEKEKKKNKMMNKNEEEYDNEDEEEKKKKKDRKKKKIIPNKSDKIHEKPNNKDEDDNEMFFIEGINESGEDVFSNGIEIKQELQNTKPKKILKNGIKNYQEGNYKSARKCFLAAIKKTEDNPNFQNNCYFLIAKTYFMQDKVKKVTKNFQLLRNTYQKLKIKKVKTINVELKSSKMSIKKLIQIGLHQKAIQVLMNLLKQKKRKREKKAKKNKNKNKNRNKKIKISEKEYKYYLFLGTVYSYQGEFVRALKYYDWIIKMKKKTKKSLNCRGEVYLEYMEKALQGNMRKDVSDTNLEIDDNKVSNNYNDLSQDLLEDDEKDTIQVSLIDAIDPIQCTRVNASGIGLNCVYNAFGEGLRDNILLGRIELSPKKHKVFLELYSTLNIEKKDLGSLKINNNKNKNNQEEQFKQVYTFFTKEYSQEKLGLILQKLVKEELPQNEKIKMKLFEKFKTLIFNKNPTSKVLHYHFGECKLIKMQLKKIHNSKTITDIIEMITNGDKTLDDFHGQKEFTTINEVINKMRQWWDEEGFCGYAKEILKVNIQGGVIQLDFLSDYFGICSVIKIRGSNSPCNTTYNFGVPMIFLEYDGFQYQYLRPIDWREQVNFNQMKKTSIMDKLSCLDPKVNFLYDTGDGLVKIMNKDTLSKSKYEVNINQLIFIEKGKQSILNHIILAGINRKFNKQRTLSRLLKYDNQFSILKSDNKHIFGIKIGNGHLYVLNLKPKIAEKEYFFKYIGILKDLDGNPLFPYFKYSITKIDEEGLTDKGTLSIQDDHKGKQKIKLTINAWETEIFINPLNVREFVGKNTQRATVTQQDSQASFFQDIAIKDFENALKKSKKDDKDYPKVQANLYYARGEYRDALEMIHNAIKRDRTQVNLYYWLGMILTKLGRFDEAIIYFELVSQISPENRQAKCMLAFSREQTRISLGKLQRDFQQFSKQNIDSKRFTTKRSLIEAVELDSNDVLPEFKLINTFIKKYIPPTYVDSNFNDTQSYQKELDTYKDHISRKVDLEGWDKQSGLAIIIRTYFAILYGLSSKIPDFWGNEDLIGMPVKFEQSLFKELFFKIEMFNIFYTNTIEGKKKKIIESLRYLLKKNQKKKPKKDRLEEISVPSGWKNHALYISFIKYSPEYTTIRIDNLGKGAENHPCDESKKRYYPYFARIKGDKNLERYISDILTAKYYEYEEINMGEDQKCGKSMIYNTDLFEKVITDFRRAREFKGILPYSPQVQGNCVVNSLAIGTGIRMGYENFSYLIKCEGLLVCDNIMAFMTKNTPSAYSLSESEVVKKELSKICEQLKCDLELEKYQDVIKNAKNVLKMRINDPKIAEICLLLAHAYLEREDFQNAKQILKKGFKYNESKWENRLLYVRVLIKLRKLEGAKKNFEMLRELNSNFKHLFDAALFAIIGNFIYKKFLFNENGNKTKMETTMESYKSESIKLLNTVVSTSFQKSGNFQGTKKEKIERITKKGAIMVFNILGNLDIALVDQDLRKEIINMMISQLLLLMKERESGVPRKELRDKFFQKLLCPNMSFVRLDLNWLRCIEQEIRRQLTPSVIVNKEESKQIEKISRPQKEKVFLPPIEWLEVSPIEEKISKQREMGLSEEFGNLKNKSQMYIPLRGRRTHNSKYTEDLCEKVEEFLVNKEKKVFLLLGGAGTGKSTFLEMLNLRLWGRYDSGNVESIIPVFVRLLMLRDPVHSIVEEVLHENWKLDKKEIQEMQKSKQLVFILDGYDEINDARNIIDKNKLLQDYSGSKVLITTRMEFLIKNYKLSFAPLNNGEYDERLLEEWYTAPFNPEQINEYLEYFIKNTDERDRRNWGVQKYHKYIKEIEGLSGLIETPYVLKVVTEVLPDIALKYIRGQEKDAYKRLKLTKNELYRTYIEKLFRRQITKLREESRLNKLLKNKIDPLELFWGYFLKLAKEMHVDQKTRVIYTTQSSNLLWKKKETNKWDQFFGDGESKMQKKMLEIARNGGLLKRIENHSGGIVYTWIHLTILEFLVVQVMNQEAENLSNEEDPDFERVYQNIKRSMNN